MKLLTIREWVGTKDGFRWITDTEKIIGMATRLPLVDAIRKLHEHEKWYRRKYIRMAVNFNLVGVSEIEDMDDETLNLLRIELIDDLTTCEDDEKNKYV